MEIGHGIQCPLVAIGHLLVFVKHPVEDQTCDKDSGKQGRKDTDNQCGGETLDGAGTEDEEDNTGDQRGDVTVNDCGIGRLVTVGQSETHSLTGPDFLTNSFKYNDVRVHSHTQSQHDTCDTGQRQNRTDGGECSENEQDVGHKGDSRDPTGPTVVEGHVNQNQAECYNEGNQAGMD